MARDRYRQHVGGARLGHGLDRLRRADAVGDIGIAHRLAGRNLPECLPDALLERGSSHIEWQVESQSRRLHEAHHLGHKLLELGVAANQIGSRETVLQIARQLIGIVAHENGTHTTLACSDQNGAEGALADGETYSVFAPPAR